MSSQVDFKQQHREYKRRLQRCAEKEEEKGRNDRRCCARWNTTDRTNGTDRWCTNDASNSPYKHNKDCDTDLLDLNSLNDCVTALGLRIMKELQKSKESFVFSPLSIACLLSMASEGATGPSKKQIDLEIFPGITDLSFKMGRLTRIPSTYKYLAYDTGHNSNAEENTMDPPKVDKGELEEFEHGFIHHAVYVEKMNQRFHETAGLYNSCSLRQHSASEDPTHSIMCGVLSRFEFSCGFDNGARAPDYMNPGAPLRDEGELFKCRENDPDNPTNILLVNWSAVKLRSGGKVWTAKGTSHVDVDIATKQKQNDIGKRLAPQMTVDCKVGQAVVDNIEVIRIYFPENTRSLVLLYPLQHGLTDLVDRLDVANMKTILNDSMNFTRKSVTLPQCRLDSVGNLNQILTTIGCGAIFGPGKDLTEILEGREFAASAALHRARIDFGLESPDVCAAAAVVYGDRPIYQPPLVHTRWIVEKPFAFFLLDETYDTIQACGCFEGQGEPGVVVDGAGPQRSVPRVKVSTDDERPTVAETENHRVTSKEKTAKRTGFGMKWKKWNICRRRVKKK